MSDPSWIRSYNNKNVYTGGSIQADTNVNSAYVSAWGWMNSAGRLRTGEYLQVDGIASENTGCGPNGLQGRDGSGMPLFCQSGVWKRQGASNGWYVSAGGYSGSTGWIWNNSGQTQFVIASGGTGINRCELSGQINVWGTIVSSGDNNDQWAKTCTITFPVPSGTAWLVTSNPYSEGAGSFSAWVYQ